jgi:hypothetical protein
MLNRMLTAPKQDFYVRRLMDEGRVLLVNLAKGRHDRPTGCAATAPRFNNCVEGAGSMGAVCSTLSSGRYSAPSADCLRTA